MAIGTIADIIRTHGRERPDSPALEHDGRSVSFRELDERSSQAAQALAAVGVKAGDRVAYIEKNGVEWFEVTFALAKLGAVASPGSPEDFAAFIAAELAKWRSVAQKANVKID